MTNAIDNAVARIQALAGSMTGITIKSTPDYAVENAEPFPFSVAYAASGEFWVDNATLLHNFPTIQIEFHVNRVNLKQMQQQINAIVYEFPRRLAGDPTLASTIDTMKMTRDEPVAYVSRPFEWGQVTSHMILFTVPLKIRQAPIT